MDAVIVENSHACNGKEEIAETVLGNTPTKAVLGSTMSFHLVSYTAQVEEMRCGSCRPYIPKKILHEVSGILRPGLNAIMGSTGSGKSTLLDVLANRKDPDCVSGRVYLDGKPIPKNFQYLSGYVVQNNLFIPTLTVREALWFCANLRLPKSVAKKEKAIKIEQILTDLSILSCADTRIGDDFIRGISGGEKKRTAIATELILEPHILFLDEPTTGLDAATAWSVVSLLKRLGNQGHTIVCSIHQPRYSIYKMFDSMTLLSKGHLVYQGDSSATLDYFQKLGYVCEIHNNPADFYLDVLNGGHGRVNAISSDVEIQDLTDSLKESFANSTIKQELDLELRKIDSVIPETTIKSKKMYATGFWHQLMVLLGRTGRNMIRNPRMLMANTIINIVISIVFGLIYLQVPDTPDKGVQNRLGVLFFFCTNLIFGSSLVIDNFIKEREIFAQEYVSGYYSLPSYYLSKLIADLVPLRSISPILFSLITYWMVGLKPDAAALFIFLLTAILCGYASVAIGVFYSVTFSEGVGRLAMILTFVFTLIFSGLLVNLEEMPAWLSWLQYLSVARYALIGFASNELRGLTFTQCGNNTVSSLMASSGPLGSVGDEDFEIISRDGVICRVLKGETFLHGTLAVGTSAENIDDWDLWQNIVALACIAVGLYTLAYIQLVRKRIYS